MRMTPTSEAVEILIPKKHTTHSCIPVALGVKYETPFDKLKNNYLALLDKAFPKGVFTCVEQRSLNRVKLEYQKTVYDQGILTYAEWLALCKLMDTVRYSNYDKKKASFKFTHAGSGYTRPKKTNKHEKKHHKKLKRINQNDPI